MLKGETIESYFDVTNIHTAILFRGDRVEPTCQDMVTFDVSNMWEICNIL